MLPVPKNVSFAQRDYFTTQANRDAGTYISRVHYPRMPGIDTYFFSVSQRRLSLDGKFNGIISVAVLPAYFNGFYARMASSDGSYFALARADGRFLARYPILKDPLVGARPRQRIAHPYRRRTANARCSRSIPRSITSSGASAIARSPAFRSMSSPAWRARRSPMSG